MINVILIARQSIFRIGLAQALRGSSDIHLAACIDRFDLVPTIIAGLPWQVLVYLPHPEDAVPDIIRQAANVICLSPWGSLGDIVAANLLAQRLQDAVRAASVHDVARIRLQNDALFAASAPTKVKLQSHAMRGASALPKVILTYHQKQVLALLIKGLTNGEIAQILEISMPTARYHVSAILNKLGASNRTEASSIAMKFNLLDETDPANG